MALFCFDKINFLMKYSQLLWSGVLQQYVTEKYTLLNTQYLLYVNTLYHCYLYTYSAHTWMNNIAGIMKKINKLSHRWFNDHWWWYISIVILITATVIFLYHTWEPSKKSMWIWKCWMIYKTRIWYELNMTQLISFSFLFQLPSEIICIFNSKRIPLESL